MQPHHNLTLKWMEQDEDGEPTAWYEFKYDMVESFPGQWRYLNPHKGKKSELESHLVVSYLAGKVCGAVEGSTSHNKINNEGLTMRV